MSMYMIAKPNSWAKPLRLFTVFFLFLAIWTPFMWFISASRQHYSMETFDVSRMNGLMIVFFIVLGVATLAAQFGYILILQEIDKPNKEV